MCSRTESMRGPLRGGSRRRCGPIMISPRTSVWSSLSVSRNGPLMDAGHRHDVGSKSNVDVVIPVRNRPRLVAHCLDSVRKQTWQPNSVIVLDDGSTDETL